MPKYAVAIRGEQASRRVNAITTEGLDLTFNIQTTLDADTPGDALDDVIEHWHIDADDLTRIHVQLASERGVE